MQIVNSTAEVRRFVSDVRKSGQKIGFVPTMGALHEGHLSLARTAKKSTFCVMSIFVNPAQFGPKEDLATYPRPIEKDIELARAAGVDILFMPTNDEVYPEGYSTYVTENHFSQGLCGTYRPNFFRGVCTVVLKLLNSVAPDELYLGEKDAQQLRVLEKMVEDLALSVRVIGCPTLREKDGLAMSSRNVYLSPQEREAAPALYRALQAAEGRFKNGERDSETLLKIFQDAITSIQGFRLQYAELRRWRDWAPVKTIDDKALLAVAAFLGETRLIDNVILRI